MSRKLAALCIGGWLMAGVWSAALAAESGPVSQAVAAPKVSCFEQITRPVSSQAFCGTCFEVCASDPRCDGKHAGDRCTNTGGVCRIQGGCDVFDCCQCVNGGLAAVFASAP